LRGEPFDKLKAVSLSNGARVRGKTLPRGNLIFFFPFSKGDSDEWE